ncbi:hypothetical protein [Halorubrum sp. AJ67]|uniref:hypothetical protein n=1 Tax=Halorubrum sp. AJ67 TaxID=1173487 RepID=UPI0003DB95B6|nr:hypothetical protein [Halorubrum sp. AJ67]CDK38615.1 hypothetical protein BN903_290 [Halorubrum sp. AJ67]
MRYVPRLYHLGGAAPTRRIRIAARRTLPAGDARVLSARHRPFVALAYPVATVALLTGTVALAVLSRSVLRTLRRRSGRVQTLTLPGLGTVEYRITTN